MVLCILDGWGYRHDDTHNAIRAADTPVMDALWHAYPHTLIEASGADVGLPDDQMGNSEVGHLTIGAGRVIRQELVRISQAVRDGSINDNPELNALADRLVTSGQTLHLIGLCSDGGVHSHVDHLGGLLRWAARHSHMTSARDHGEMTLEMFNVGSSRLGKELEKLMGWLEHTERPDIVCLSTALLAGFAEPLKRRLGAPVVTFFQSQRFQPVYSESAR